jgi:hypothetical protein
VLASAAVGGCGLKPAPRENPAIVTSTLPDAIVGRAYALQLEVEKGSPPFTWSLADVPDALQWLTVDPATGALGGTPTALVTLGATFTVTVTDVIHRSDSKALTLAVTEAPVIVTEALPDAVLGTSYSMIMEAEGGTPPLTWSLRDLSPALEWLAIDPATGTLGGTPTAAVDPGASFTVTVTGADQLEGSRSFTLTVKGPPTIVTASLPNAFVHSAYSAVVEAEGGTPPFAWSLRDLPRALGWLTIDPATGALGGTPTAVVQPGATFTVIASDANHLEGSRALTLAARTCEEGEQAGCWPSAAPATSAWPACRRARAGPGRWVLARRRRQRQPRSPTAAPAPPRAPAARAIAPGPTHASTGGAAAAARPAPVPVSCAAEAAASTRAPAGAAAAPATPPALPLPATVSTANACAAPDRGVRPG